MTEALLHGLREPTHMIEFDCYQVNGGRRLNFFVAYIGLKGDWPWLRKAYGLSVGFTSRRKCHLCPGDASRLHSCERVNDRNCTCFEDKQNPARIGGTWVPIRKSGHGMVSAPTPTTGGRSPLSEQYHLAMTCPGSNQTFSIVSIWALARTSRLAPFYYSRGLESGLEEI